MNADTPRPKILVCGGQSAGKSWARQQVIEAARAMGCEVVEVGPNHQFGAFGEFLSFDEAKSIPVPELRGACPDHTPDWKRPKYFGNRRRKK